MVENSVAKHLYKNQGLTLLEVLAVVIILGIVAAIAVPGVLGYIEKTRADVCDVNMKSLERNYEVHLAIESIEHSTVVFLSIFVSMEKRFVLILERLLMVMEESVVVFMIMVRVMGQKILGRMYLFCNGVFLYWLNGVEELTIMLRLNDRNLAG